MKYFIDREIYGTKNGGKYPPRRIPCTVYEDTVDQVTAYDKDGNSYGLSATEVFEDGLDGKIEDEFFAGYIEQLSGNFWVQRASKGYSLYNRLSDGKFVFLPTSYDLREDDIEALRSDEDALKRFLNENQ